MTYTVWHSGVLIGESDLEREDEGRPNHLAGIFRPTSHGRRIVPLLSGIMTAGADLKDELAHRGLHEDDMSSDMVADVLENTAAGRKVIDIGRNLSEVELRDATGAVRELKSIAFIDTGELARLMDRLECGSREEHEAVRHEQAPEFILSATFKAPDRDAIGRHRLTSPSAN